MEREANNLRREEGRKGGNKFQPKESQKWDQKWDPRNGVVLGLKIKSGLRKKAEFSGCPSQIRID